MSDLDDPRVLFAAERTMLAWNRTSVVLITFGFMVERSNILMPVLAPEQSDPVGSAMTFWLGIAFIVLGAFSAAFSSRQYLVVLRTLSPSEFPSGYRVTWGFMVNVVVAALGMALAMVLAFGR
ncbi:YidH family protein [Marinobacter lacisalsi]|uniref:YidH family protein n=1 Tax=Marinobacter lacisalsi TaxID=475979 RepID=A0ABV8QMW6_9GAMM